MTVCLAYAENWVSFGSFGEGHSVKRTFVDTHSLRKTGPAEYTITQRDEYNFPQTTQSGAVYTSSLSTQRVRCDTREFGTARIAVFDENGKMVLDTGPLDNKPKYKADPNTVGEALLHTVCD
jgi:hypothetical protein